MPRPLRCLTWNLHGFIGEGRRPDPERSLRVIREIDADVAALQEVDGRTRLGRLPKAFERLTAGLGGFVLEARLFGEGETAYGHMLWSRYPLSGEVVLLPGPGNEPRGVIRARVETPRGPLHVLATHFGLRPQARRRQAEAVAGLVGSGPTIALGDFNEWNPKGGVDRRLRAVLSARAALASWPAQRPLVPLDRAYAGGGARIVGARTAPATAPASDHLGLVVDLEF
ncbi:endonuclease/exonuclease/phosphatase family protein [Aureimonas jatrophae]|uniref:Metal-dependent hydrolase, endonuclease/exonuclease/phosphatase family n=1 Tax=Aureimonas jatrophae TaxID=1166073 RepID=A0A1H0KKY9_9HYPH|nr:endonuclease/exonuclease/phosphatase family protein [Aureimonas jatrophae]MBB3948751.1 endonuclease/exonuclease/phosphatase family metal-dependent hydrolase [Aureimonas jatrophae]SDO56420.1 Metal-dependent hydrolase, endonuclease/exonuclease/phosphatase family [Aureimonas jatrophae]